MMPHAAEIADAFGGHPDGKGAYRCDCPLCGGHNLVLSDGKRRLLVKCWNGCEQKDLLDELHSRGFYGSSQAGNGHDPDPPEGAAAHREKIAKGQRETRNRTENALDVWKGAYPAKGSMAEVYFGSRLLMLPIPDTLRVANNVYRPTSKDRRPHLVGLIEHQDKGPIGLALIALNPLDASVKATGDDRKWTKGPRGGGAVRLFPAGPVLALSEGIEDALTFTQETTTPAWAAITADGMRSFVPPPLTVTQTIILIEDQDENQTGQRAIAATAHRLAKLGYKIQICRPKGGQKDLNAALRAIGTGNPLFDLTDYDAEPPRIDVHLGLYHRAADLGLAALAAAGVPFYQRDRKLVTVVRVKAKTFGGDEIFVPAIGEVTMPLLLRALGQSAYWEKPDQRASGGTRRIEPPQQIAEQILAMVGDWSFPPITGLIACPTLRPDGSLLLKPGYDPVTGYVLDYDFPVPSIPERPSRDDALTALATIAALLCEFPFRDDTSRGVAYSAMLTPVLRPAMGVAPLHGCNAPQAGTGKSYLWDIACLIATGERCAAISLTGDEMEDEKRLVAQALAGLPVIGIDNVTCPITGAFLCQLTERPLLRPRVLGGHKSPTIPNSFSCLLNGNNTEVEGDMVRRVVMTHLDANMENPELREFAQDPLAMIRADRGKYVAAALTIARAYVIAGKPDRLPPLASYAEWSDLVRSALVWLGCGDPVASMAETRLVDPIRTARSAIFAAWVRNPALGRSRVTTAAIVKATETDLDLRDAILKVAEGKARGEVSSVMLGQWMGRNKDNVANGYKLVREADPAGKHIYWQLFDIGG